MTKVAAIGAGYWGKNLVKTFYELDALGAVVESIESLREGISNSYPGVPIYANYKAVLQDARIDGVVIATPAESHYQIAKDAILAGKDVFVEKPMVLDSSQAQELVKLADHHNRILMVGHLLLYQPAILKMKSFIDAGEIGQLRSIHQERLKLGRVRKVENVLWSFGVHDIAVFLYLVESFPTHIDAFGQKVIQSNIEDEVYLHLSFDEQVKAHLHVSWLSPETRRRLTIVGTEGMLVYEESDGKVELHKKGINADLSNRDEGTYEVCEADIRPLTLECQHFLDCVQTRTAPRSDGQNGMDVVKILESASIKLEVLGGRKIGSR